MTTKDSVSIDATKTFASQDEGDAYRSLIGKQVSGYLEGNGNRFYGTLESFDEHMLYLRGNRGQLLLVKRRRIAKLEAI